MARTRTIMGRFDRRNSMKMKRKRAQNKKKARDKRASAVEAPKAEKKRPAKKTKSAS